MLRVRMGEADAHYGGGVVDGARLLRLFGDLITEITIRTDGDEGLLSTYTDVRFLAVVRPGDYIEATARLAAATRLRRTVVFEAHKVIAARPDLRPTAAAVLAEPVLVCTATAVAVVPIAAARRRTGSPAPSAGPADGDAAAAGLLPPARGES